jgi:hypothetical protein
MSRYIFGIHSLTPYNRTDGKAYGILKVLGGANMELAGESEDLFGGSSKFAYASEQTQIGATMTLNVKSFPDFLMELFLGGTTTSIAAAANGEVRNLANKNGTSVSKADTGIASVALKSGDEADAKFGRYVVVAKTTTTVSLYLLTDIDFNRGTQGSFDSTLLIADDITIPDTDGTVDVDDYGLEITGGSGTVAMVVGDTAIFDVLPPHTGGSEIVIGSENSVFPEFGAFILAQKRSSGAIFQIEAFKCVGNGMPFPLQEKTWMISDLTVKLLRDETTDAVMKITAFDEI